MSETETYRDRLETEKFVLHPCRMVKTGAIPRALRMTHYRHHMVALRTQLYNVCEAFSQIRTIVRQQRHLRYSVTLKDFQNVFLSTLIRKGIHLGRQERGSRLEVDLQQFGISDTNFSPTHSLMHETDPLEQASRR